MPQMTKGGKFVFGKSLIRQSIKKLKIEYYRIT